MKFLKKNLLWVFCGGLGLLTLIFLAIPYATIVSGGFGISVKAPVNGYSIMSYWSFQSGGVLSSVMQILVLLTALAMIAISVIGILMGTGVIKSKPKADDKPGKSVLEKTGGILMYIFAGLNFFLMIFLFLMCSQNSTENFGVFYGHKISAGVFVMLIFAIAAIVAYILLNKKIKKGEAAKAQATPAAESSENADNSGSISNSDSNSANEVPAANETPAVANETAEQTDEQKEEN